MSSNLTASLLPVVVNAINTYGVEVTVYRNVYENEFGVRTLMQQQLEVCKIKVVIDNSATNKSTKFRVEGIVRPEQSATIYYAYDEQIKIKQEDYFIIDDIKYILNQPQDILHYHILYQVSAEVTANE